jgi:glycosyltransferase involved in cell wall biosynthesis
MINKVQKLEVTLKQHGYYNYRDRWRKAYNSNFKLLWVKAMKILMIAPTPFFSDRGCHVRVYEEAKNLISLGNSVTICTYHLGEDIPGIDVRRIINIPWYKKISAGPSIQKIYLDFLLLVKSIFITYQTKPDIIHAHLNEGALIGKICSLLFRVPLVFDIQGEFTSEVRAHKFLKEYPFLYKLINKVAPILEKLSYKTANAFLVNSSYMSNHLHQTFGIKKESIFVVPDGAESPDQNSSDEIESLGKRLNIPTDKKIVVYLGLLTEYQGVDLLLKAVKSIVEKRDDLHFLIIGYPNVEHYKKISEDLNISQYITFTGRVSYWEIYNYLALATIAVSPKILDLGGEANIKLYNYIAAGLPSVVFDYLVNREILGDLGIYARPGDPISLENCMIKLVDDDELRGDLVEKLKAINIEKYSWRNSINKLQEAYLFVKRKDIPYNGTERL